MITLTDETDDLIDALVPLVPLQGWTMSSLRQALADLGHDPADAPLIFPGGAAEMIEYWSSLTDRRMSEAAIAADLAAYRTPGRVRAIISLRLELLRDHKTAASRALAILALPDTAALAARLTARTVDEIWHAAGDKSADFAWYTKRALLAGVYGSTLLYWLRDSSFDDEPTLAFLDRRLANVAQIGKLTAGRRKKQ
ncbi:MAG TPA: COQ9 family protein [Acetobacteraceae bacterium]|nr:COQ9 family protein [Acetobacteraceae bacterium]